MTAMAPEIVEECETVGTLSSAFDDANVRSGDTSAGKALALLDAFSGPLSVLGVTALAARADIPKSTAHRLLNVLVSSGYVRRVGDRYCLTERMFEIGNQVRVCRPNGIREIAMPYLAELFAQTRQTVHLAVLSGTDVLYLNKVFGYESPRCPTLVGSRRPAYATALGKALLAFSDPKAVEANLNIHFTRFTPYTLATASQLQRCLEQVNVDGMATDHEEMLRGVSCIAAPILDSRSGSAIAAVSICSVGSLAEKRYSRALLRATTELSRLRIPEL
jgi:DNA-binding IclR family transcriptional regulator